MDILFESTFSTLCASGKSLSRCGKCRRYMKYIQTKPARLHCSTCDETYTLPPKGMIRVYRELKCPLDDFELVSWFNGAKGKSFPLCPYCYNHPPFRDMSKNSGCNSCPHPTCAHSLSSLGVSSCFECDRGVLVLDCTLAPKHRLVCNFCDVIISCFDDAVKVTVEDSCEECGAQQVTAIYKQDKTPFTDGAAEKKGCIFCYSEFVPLVEKHKAVEMRRNQAGGRGGRGRGFRGRGGKGGRGRNKPPKDKMAQLAAYFV